MPRSGPGAVTGAPSSITRPVLGESSPATMRSSVDLPQPERPRRQMKSLASTARSVFSGARQQYALDDVAARGAERVRRLDQLAPRRADDDCDHQHDLEHRADEDHRQLLRLADSGPQDQQRNERRGWQIPRERNEGLEER